MVDKLAESLFEMKYDDLIKSNIFELMIPFSLYYLKKKMGPSIFSSLDSQSKTFTYTIYSKRASKKYKKLISHLDRKEDHERRKLIEKEKFSPEETHLYNEDNKLYYKHLQSLTSRATLVELKFSKVDDLMKLESSQDIKIKLEHTIFKKIPPKNADKIISQPAVLLLTRKGQHIQRFKYGFMEQYDENILLMEKKIGNRLNKLKRKIAKKDEDFRMKCERNHSSSNQTEVFIDDSPSPDC